MNQTPPHWDFKQGEVLLVDKPQGWSSFDVIRKLKKPLGAKVGHAGTLDPMATGLLILCTGHKTKAIETYQAQEKEYTGTVCLGRTTPSYDAETEADAHFPVDHIDEALVHETARRFLGEQQQTPPAYSAIKVQGKRAYQMARKGEAVQIKSRTVAIHELEVLRVEASRVDFQVRCSKGTYIRTLAHDWAREMDSGGHLCALRRTAIGPHRIEDAWTVEALLEALRAAQNPLE